MARPSKDGGTSAQSGLDEGVFARAFIQEQSGGIRAYEDRSTQIRIRHCITTTIGTLGDREHQSVGASLSLERPSVEMERQSFEWMRAYAWNIIIVCCLLYTHIAYWSQIQQN